MQTSILKLYGQALKDHWIVYSLGALSLVLTSISEMMIPKFIQWSLDYVSMASDKKSLGTFAKIEARAALELYALALLGSMSLGFIGRVGWRHLLARRTHEAGFKMKVEFWNSLRFQPLRIFERYSLGDLMNRATGDWHAARVIHGFTLVLTLDLVFFTVIAVIMMLTIDPYLTLLSLMIFPFLPKKILGLARKEHDYHLEAQERLSDLSQGITEILASLRFHRATDSEGIKLAKIKKQAEIYAEARTRVVKTGWKIYPLGALPTLAAYGFLLTFGLWQVASGRITIGAFVALQSYVLMLQGPLLELGDCIAEWQRGFASLGRIQEIIGLGKTPNAPKLAAPLFETKTNTPSLAENTPLEIEFHTVSFSYETSQDKTLDSVDFRVKAGEKIGIVGPIGAGKSTLLKLSAQLLEPLSGEITFNKVPLSSYENDWVRKHVTLIGQKPFLFASTVRSNLCLNERIAEETLWQVLETVSLAEDVRRLPDKLDSVLGESGTNLSGGQRQRLALARAVLRLKPIVLIDDALSAVDAKTEHSILTKFQDLLKNKTVIWVAHRMGTLTLCSKLYRMERGILSPIEPSFRTVEGQ